MKNMETSHQNKSTESTNAEATTSSQHFGNALLPDALLSPRYKVIGLWPGCGTIEIGNIIKLEYNDMGFLFSNNSNHGPIWRKVTLDKYPQLFKKLEWWEERKTGEIEYVKWESSTPNKWFVTKVSEIKHNHFKCDLDNAWATFTKGQDLPATESEYLSYIEGLKK